MLLKRCKVTSKGKFLRTETKNLLTEEIKNNKYYNNYCKNFCKYYNTVCCLSKSVCGYYIFHQNIPGKLIKTLNYRYYIEQK